MKRYKSLSGEEKEVLLEKGTERPGTGVYYHHDEVGLYVCKQCMSPLFLSSHKFFSSCGWPSFEGEIAGAVERRIDSDGERTEIVCHKCKGHLGHVFTGEKCTPKNLRHCVNALSLLFIPAFTEEELARAIFAGGCFWGVEYWMRRLPGVIRTQAGYIGGAVDNPSYEEVCSGKTGHAEAVEVVFDPSLVSYSDLVKCFFEIHDPSEKERQGPDVGPQYRSAIFYLTQKQQEIALEMKALLEKKGIFVATEIVPGSIFYRAEEDHQQYYEKVRREPSCHKRVRRF